MISQRGPIDLMDASPRLVIDTRHPVSFSRREAVNRGLNRVFFKSCHSAQHENKHNMGPLK